MGYVLRAVLGELATLAHAAPLLTHSMIVPLSVTVGLIPVTDDLIDSLNTGQPTTQDAFPGLRYLSTPLADVLVSLSGRGLVAYVEADYFGGVGEQAAVAWRDGRAVMEPAQRVGAISQALRLLGVRKSSTQDEFDVAGLGRHRATEDWLEEGEEAEQP